MLSINIICVGKIKEKFFNSAIDEYSKRLSKYCKLEITQLPDEKIPDKVNENIINEIKEKECNNIINHLKKDSYVIALDLKGSELDSIQFSKKIDSFLDEKSDQLIKEWSLATTNDLDVLEKKFSDTANSVDDLEKKFKKFKKSSVKFREETESRLDDLDKRINSLENK